jgi:hypothetical protein
MSWSVLNNMVMQGCANQALHGKRLIFISNRDVFDRLTFDDHETFLSPFIFAIRDASIGYDVSALCAAASMARHADSAGIRVRARSNANGIIFLPALGYVALGRRGINDVVLQLGNDIHYCVFEEDGIKRRRACIRPLTYMHPYLFILLETSTPLIPNTQDVHGNVLSLGDGDFATQLELDKLRDAINTIRIVSGEYYTAMQHTCRYFVTIDGRSDVNSFTTEELPGISFLSMPAVKSAPYFIEDIVHQCGHNI